MARKSRAEANLARVISPNFKGRRYASMYQRRISPHKWVVKIDYSTHKMIAGKQARVPVYIVVGLNHAGYMATVALRTSDKPTAVRAAALLNKRIGEEERELS